MRLSKTAAREVARSMNPMTKKQFARQQDFFDYCWRRRQRIAAQSLFFMGVPMVRAEGVVAGISSQARLSLNTLIDAGLDCLSDY